MPKYSKLVNAIPGRVVKRSCDKNRGDVVTVPRRKKHDEGRKKTFVKKTFVEKTVVKKTVVKKTVVKKTQYNGKNTSIVTRTTTDKVGKSYNKKTAIKSNKSAMQSVTMNALPMMTSRIPEMIETILITESGIPEMIETIPITENGIPEMIETKPITERRIPEMMETIPITQSRIPETMPTIPIITID